MDRKLHALVKLDVAADVVRIDVRGSLNQESRPALVHVIRRIRRMGVTAHIRVDLSQAAFVESPALVGLRNDLNAIDGGSSDGDTSTASGVSLEFMPRPDALVWRYMFKGPFSMAAELGEFLGELDATSNMRTFTVFDVASGCAVGSASDARNARTSCVSIRSMRHSRGR